MPGLWQEGFLGRGLGSEEGDQTPEVSPLSRLRRHLVQGENLQRHSGTGEGAASTDKIMGFSMVFLWFSENLLKFGHPQALIYSIPFRPEPGGNQHMTPSEVRHKEELLSEEQLIETTVGEGELCRELRFAAVEWRAGEFW